MLMLVPRFQIIAGLNENYDGVAAILQQSNPLPSFYEARSRLILEETRKAKQAATTIGATSTAGTALLITNSSNDLRSSNSDSDLPSYRTSHGQKEGPPRNNHRGQYNGGRSRGCGGNHQRGGRNFRGGSTSPQNQQQHAWSQQPPWAAYPPWASWTTWAAPPYPTSFWARPPIRQPGILGSRPQQAYVAHTTPLPAMNPRILRRQCTL